jgi:hypothetical protein
MSSKQLMALFLIRRHAAFPADNVLDWFQSRRLRLLIAAMFAFKQGNKPFMLVAASACKLHISSSL